MNLKSMMLSRHVQTQMPPCYMILTICFSGTKGTVRDGKLIIGYEELEAGTEADNKGLRGNFGG